MQVKSFHVGDILSITTGVLASPNHMGGVYDILDFMTGEGLFTHQLPRAAEACAPELAAQLPEVAAYGCPPQINGAEAVAVWVDFVAREVGEFHYVATLPPGVYRRMGPIQEFAEIAPGKPVITAVI